MNTGEYGYAICHKFNAQPLRYCFTQFLPSHILRGLRVSPDFESSVEFAWLIKIELT
jgi:hypothetical protein